ncbi:MAG: glutathione transporter ATP-binding protein GsiA, partial [Hyphomicrobiales bacterium]|nr:glutathione transporter ATP-binding protein GsiA [Hyphomicrobiales bacterium]
FPGVDGAFVAVEDLSFDLATGETLAIVGESGSGKSVTAKSIMRLVDYMNGEIRGGSIRFKPDESASVDLATLDESGLRKLRGKAMALVFQEPMTSLNPVLTIGDQVAEVVLLHETMSKTAARARALEALRQVRIPEAERRLRQYPHELSGGMRQRVMIAMALACRPALLIADEPTTALDVTIQAEILSLLKALQAEIGMAILFITHDMGVVAEIADRVLVMKQGRKVEEGLVSQIFHAPVHPYTRALLSAVPKLGSMTGKPRPERFEGVLADASAPIRLPGTTPHEPSYREKPILEVVGLTVRFRIRKGLMQRVVANVHAVENVSFKLFPGETLSIVGESGSGKSTTGRSILKLIESTSGDILLRGRNITNHTPAVMRDARRHIQMVFQDPFASLNPRMSVEQLVGEPFHVHEELDRAQIRVRVTDLLERVGLGEEHLQRYPFEFSGGQRQRICIARALALNPSIIIADEAVSALDVSIRAQVINLMMDLQEELGLSYLFISHDIAVVERISHRIAVMYLGEIVEMGPREAILGNPRHPYTRKLIAAVPIADPDARVARTLSAGEIPSAVRPRGYEPKARSLEEVAPGHFVLPH